MSKAVNQLLPKGATDDKESLGQPWVDHDVTPSRQARPSSSRQPEIHLDEAQGNKAKPKQRISNQHEKQGKKKTKKRRRNPSAFRALELPTSTFQLGKCWMLGQVTLAFGLL